MTTALLKFGQNGGATGGDGEAFVYDIAVGSYVSIGNSAGGGTVSSWRIELLYAPPGSPMEQAVGGPQPGVPQVLAENSNDSTPAYDITPDSGYYGCYRIKLTVWSGTGYTGLVDVDIRNIGVPTPNSKFIIPPYQDLPEPLPVLGSGETGEKPDEMNFDGQVYGWDGDDGSVTHKQLSAALSHLDGVVPPTTPSQDNQLCFANAGVQDYAAGITVLDVGGAEDGLALTDIQASSTNLNVVGQNIWIYSEDDGNILIDDGHGYIFLEAGEIYIGDAPIIFQDWGDATIYHDDRATSGAAGKDFIIHAQDTTGGNGNTGGDLVLRGGLATGSSHGLSGSVVLQGADGTPIFIVNDGIGYDPHVELPAAKMVIGTGTVPPEGVFRLTASVGSSYPVLLAANDGSNDYSLIFWDYTGSITGNAALFFGMGGGTTVDFFYGGNDVYVAALNSFQIVNSSMDPLFVLNESMDEPENGEVLQWNSTNGAAEWVNGSGVGLTPPSGEAYQVVFVNAAGNNLTYADNVKIDTSEAALSIGADPAQSGALRLANNQWITFRAPDTSDRNALKVTSADRIQLGDTATLVDIYAGGGVVLQVGSGFIRVWQSNWNFAASVATPLIQHNTDTAAGIAGDTFTIHAQDTSGGTGNTGGDLVLRGGYASGVGAGVSGSVDIQAGDGTTLLKLGDTTGEPSGGYILQWNGSNEEAEWVEFNPMTAPGGSGDAYKVAFADSGGTNLDYADNVKISSDQFAIAFGSAPATSGEIRGGSGISVVGVDGSSNDAVLLDWSTPALTLGSSGYVQTVDYKALSYTKTHEFYSDDVLIAAFDRSGSSSDPSRLLFSKLRAATIKLENLTFAAGGARTLSILGQDGYGTSEAGGDIDIGSGAPGPGGEMGVINLKSGSTTILTISDRQMLLRETFAPSSTPISGYAHLWIDSTEKKLKIWFDNDTIVDIAQA